MQGRLVVSETALPPAAKSTHNPSSFGEHRATQILIKGWNLWLLSYWLIYDVFTRSDFHGKRSQQDTNRSPCRPDKYKDFARMLFEHVSSATCCALRQFLYSKINPCACVLYHLIANDKLQPVVYSLIFLTSSCSHWLVVQCWRWQMQCKQLSKHTVPDLPWLQIKLSITSDGKKSTMKPTVHNSKQFPGVCDSERVHIFANKLAICYFHAEPA